MNGSLLPWIASVLVLAGGLFSLLGAVGVMRLPDCYSRMHAASKAGALGAVMILAGVAAASGGEVALEAILALLVLLGTAPLAAHAISRSAYRSGIRPILGPLGNVLNSDALARTSGAEPSLEEQEPAGQSAADATPPPRAE